MNINRGNPGRFEVLVDSWPHFGAVLARPSGEVAMVGGGVWVGTGGRGVGTATLRAPGTHGCCVGAAG